MAKVEVEWSNNCEIYHLDPTTGEYDAKIDVYPDHTETYRSNDDSYWAEHDHYHTDKDGNTTECHPMEARNWTTRSRF